MPAQAGLGPCRLDSAGPQAVLAECTLCRTDALQGRGGFCCGQMAAEQQATLRRSIQPSQPRGKQQWNGQAMLNRTLLAEAEASVEHVVLAGCSQSDSCQPKGATTEDTPLDAACQLQG